MQNEELQKIKQAVTAYEDFRTEFNPLMRRLGELATEFTELHRILRTAYEEIVRDLSKILEES